MSLVPVCARDRRTRSTVTRLFVAFGLVLAAACGGAPGPGPTSSDQPRHGGTLRLVEEAPSSLDPIVGDSVYESLPLNQIFDTLIDFDSTLNLVPGLAETWTISRDGLVHTFRLREGVRFHDGSELTAEDVRFSLMRNLAPENEGRSLAFGALLVVAGAPEYASGQADDVPGIRVIDPRTIEIRLARPYTSFLEVLAMDALSVVPERVVREVGDEVFGRAPVGTGPFRLDSWDEQGLRMVAVADHFGGAPLLDAVEIRFLRDDEQDHGAKRLLDDAVDVLEPSASTLELLEADPRIRLRRYQELSLTFLGLNTGQEPLDRPWVRQAVARAIDRASLVRENPTLRRGAVGILPPGLPCFSPESKAIAYDPDRARALLASHGHPGGEGLPPIRIVMTTMGPTARQILDRVRSDLEAVGLRLELDLVTWSVLSERLEHRVAPSFLLVWVADRTDPDAFLRALFARRGSANYFAYGSDSVEDLLDRGARELNPEERSRLYRDLERTILADAPMVPLYHTVGVVAIRDAVHGLEPTPLGLAKAGLQRVWLSRDGDAS